MNAYICAACDAATLTTHDPGLVLCSHCATEALLSDAADAVARNGESVDIEYRALCSAAHGERWLA
jgi:hypothetical protein